jgi:hypothetical protein
MSARRSEESLPGFHTILQADVPKGRNGKHHLIVARILKELGRLKEGAALRVPLADLAESKAKVRSAVNRETRKQGRNVATASDGDYLYIWNVPK